MDSSSNISSIIFRIILAIVVVGGLLFARSFKCEDCGERSFGTKYNCDLGYKEVTWCEDCFKDNGGYTLFNLK